jgi:hypothetical protein
VIRDAVHFKVAAALLSIEDLLRMSEFLGGKESFVA